MQFDLKTNPFSAPEAFLSIIQEPDYRGGGVWIKSLIRPEWGTGNPHISNLLLKIIPTSLSGAFCPYEVIAKPTHVDLITESGYLRIYFIKYNEIKIELNNTNVIFEYGHLNNQASDIKSDNGVFSLTYPKLNQYIKLEFDNSNFKNHEAIKRVVVDQIENSTINFSFWVNNLKHPTKYTKYNSLNDVKNDYQSFLSYYNIADYHDELAVYTLWSLEFVECGNFLSNAIPANKNDMNLSWGWDNLLVALAIVKSNPSLAWSAIEVFFKHQSDDGMLPDAINPVILVDWYTKPPVHGYFLQKMHQKGFTLSTNQTKYVYEVLSKSIDWWIDPKDTFPKYKEPFDSGWDNATVFDNGADITTPDLVSYLIIQMDYLSKLANNLNLDKESLYWIERRDQLLNDFISRLWDGKQFLSLRQDKTFETTSLIKMIPIILEDLLPKHIMITLINELKIENHYLVRNGFASETVDSLLYRSYDGDQYKLNSYWRGPIWSPPMYMITESLKVVGETEFANDVVNRYLNVIKHSNAFYENYDANLSIGYDDFGFGWTAAAYILLKAIDK